MGGRKVELKTAIECGIIPYCQNLGFPCRACGQDRLDVNEAVRKATDHSIGGLIGHCDCGTFTIIPTNMGNLQVTAWCMPHPNSQFLSDAWQHVSTSFVGFSACHASSRPELEYAPANNANPPMLGCDCGCTMHPEYIVREKVASDTVGWAGYCRCGRYVILPTRPMNSKGYTFVPVISNALIDAWFARKALVTSSRYDFGAPPQARLYGVTPKPADPYEGLSSKDFFNKIMGKDF